METYRDDDEGYLAWHKDRGAGFVFNHFGGRNPAFNVLHRSTCAFLWRGIDEGTRTTVEKWCSESEQELKQQADSILGTDMWKHCGVCFRSALSNNATASSAPVPPAPRTLGESQDNESVVIAGEPAVWLGSGVKAWKELAMSAFEAVPPSRPPEWIDVEFRLLEERLYLKDIDNLVTPILESARDAGWVERGFAWLGSVTARKVAVCDQAEIGAVVTPHAQPLEVRTNRMGILVETTLSELNEAAVKWALYDTAFALYQRRPELRFPPQSPVSIDVRVTIDDSGRRKSIGALLKPCIDGLEPVLGHPSNLLPEPRDIMKRRLAPQDEMVLSLAFHVRGGRSNTVSVLISPLLGANLRDKG